MAEKSRIPLFMSDPLLVLLLGILTGGPSLTSWNRATLLLILGIFFPMVAAMIVQGHVNELST